MSKVLEYCQRLRSGELTKAGPVDCKWLADDMERKFKEDMYWLASRSQEMHAGAMTEAEFMAKVVEFLNV